MTKKHMEESSDSYFLEKSDFELSASKIAIQQVGRKGKIEGINMVVP